MNIEDTQQYLDGFLKERGKAITDRKSSGIEDVWSAARVQYHHGTSEPVVSKTKSRNLDDPIYTNYQEHSEQERSTVSVNITRPYTNAGTARPMDVMLPAGERDTWDLRETPVSDTALLQPYFENRPDLLEQVSPSLHFLLTQPEEERKERIVRCKQTVKDYLTEAGFSAILRKIIRESGITGTGVLHGLFAQDRKVSPDVEQAVKVLIGDASVESQSLMQFQLGMQLLVRPGQEQIPVENCYPDSQCGTDIQKGRFFWQVVPDLSARKLRELRASKDYFAEAIDQVLEEGPKPVTETGETKKKSYEIWRRTGEVNITKLMGNDDLVNQVAHFVGKKPDMLGDWEFLQLEFINEVLVKINALPTNSGKFPYLFLKWEERVDSPFGIGIPEQLETPQRGLNAAVRAAADNLAWSVGPGMLHWAGLIEPEDGNFKHHPYKVYKVAVDHLQVLTGKEMDPKKALQFLEFPNYLGDILPWINYWLQMAETTSGLPLLLQGQKASDSVGVTNALMSASTTNLRLFIKHADDDVIRPIIQENYAWTQLYGPENLKTDAVAYALGSSILVERELQQQAIIQTLDRAVQPIFGLSPSQLARRFVESFGLNYDDVKMTEEEKAQLEAAEQAPDVKVQVAELEGRVDIQVEEMRRQTAEMKAMLDAQLRGLSIDQAREAVETQGLANITQEVVKQEGSEALKGKVGSERLAEAGGEGSLGAPTVAVAKPIESEVTDEDLELLGI